MSVLGGGPKKDPPLSFNALIILIRDCVYNFLLLLCLGSLVCDVYCDFVTFPCNVTGQVWCLIVPISEHCPLS